MALLSVLLLAVTATSSAQTAPMNTIAVSPSVHSTVWMLPAMTVGRAWFCLRGALFGKYVGARLCLNTVAQLPACFCTQSFHIDM